MTTTHTYQGLNADGKPSSRVLNPPGGSSSNIFGGSDEPQQKVPIRNNPDNINRSNNDVFGPGHNAATVPQQKSRAPRSAFNPITGEAYEQPKTKQEASAPVYNAPSKTDAVSSHKLETCEAPVSATVLDQETAQPAANEEQPASTLVADHKKQQQSGVFGGSEDAKELRSTRVSQPPGGRSTKLW